MQAIEARHLLYDRRQVIETATTLAVLAVGAGVVTVAYGMARTNSGTGYYSIFWVGFGLGYVAVGRQIIRRRAELPWLLVLGAFTFLPKLLMSPSGPIYYDETAHFQLLRETISSGMLFRHTSLLPIGTYYPGLESATAAVHFVSGASPWISALIVLAIAHCLVPALIYLVVKEIPTAARYAGVAALVYVLNPSYVYFDSQFAYESVALVFVFATLGFALRAVRASTRAEALGNGILAASVGAGCVVTHHVSGAALAVLLVLVAVLAERRSAPSPLPNAIRRLARYGPVVVVVAALGSWVAFVAPSTIAYLSPTFASPIRDVASLLGLRHSPLPGVLGGSAVHTIFLRSTLPAYERIAAFVAPVLLGAVCLMAGIRWIKSRSIRSNASWAFLVAVAYFVALPLTLLSGGSVGSHRSSATTFVGIGIVIAVAAIWAEGRLRWRRWYGAALAVTMVIVLMGSVAQGVAADYRFPGPYEYGSDTRSVTPQTKALAAWVLKHLGPRSHVITDRYTALPLITEADAVAPRQTTGLPIGEFWYDRYPPGPSLLRKLQSGHDSYLVVDQRSITHTPVEASLFFAGEPARVPARNLSRLNEWPWLIKLYQSHDYTVYRISFSGYRAWYPTHAGEH